jgi:hypothetical protein
MWALILVAIIWGLTNASMKAFSVACLDASVVKSNRSRKPATPTPIGGNVVSELGYYISFAVNLMGSALYYKSIGDAGIKNVHHFYKTI